MKEKSFKFRESYSKAIKSMNDKQAGKFLKGLCEYVFEGRNFDSKDSTLNSSFTLIKNALEQEKFFAEAGRRGGKLSAEKRKNNNIGMTVISKLCAQNNPVDDIFKMVVEMLENEEKQDDENGSESVAKD